MTDKFYNIVIERLLRDTTLEYENGELIHILPPMISAFNIISNIIPYGDERNIYIREVDYKRGGEIVTFMYCKYMKKLYGVKTCDCDKIWEIYVERLREII